MKSDLVIWWGGALAIVLVVVLWLAFGGQETDLLPSTYSYGVL